jgi:hypothetical protein
VPLGGGALVGQPEKRMNVFSWLGLEQDVASYGDKNKSLWDTMLMDDSAEWHNNHGEDPGTSTLNMTDSATLLMEMLRPITSNLNLQQYAHATLDGYHPPDGESELSLDVLAGETVYYGSPAYIASSNTANLASAEDGIKSKAIGFITQAASAGLATIVRTDGSITLGNWEAITDTISLTPGATYFLHTTAGQMRTTPPTGDGQVVVTLGVAVDETTFDIEINEIAVL